ncbi:hypothetical protein AN1V17_40520 [Vallitalea sediminicola]|jgi:hypothetical protein
MGCNNLNSCCGVGSAVLSGSNKSVQYGYTERTIELAGASGVFEIWDALNLNGLTGTVDIRGDLIPATTNVIINGINTTAITNNIFSRSIDPLNSVSIYATTSATTSIIASVIATAFDY